MASKQHLHHTEQDSEAGLQENMGDEFLGPFSLWKRVRNKSCVSQDFQHLLWRSLCRNGSGSFNLILHRLWVVFRVPCSATQWKYQSLLMLVHRWTFQDRLYAPNNGCNAYLCSLFSCHISSTFYVNIYFSRLFSFLQSFSLGRSDFTSSPEQFLSLEAKAICIAAGVLMD